jgi:hypothetical protein
VHDRNESSSPLTSSPATAPAPESPIAAAQVEYFHAPNHYRPSPGPGFLLGVLGLALIFLGGCFMIGLLAVYGNNAMTWNGAGVYIYVVTLYVFAILCLGGAGILLRLGVRSVLKADVGASDVEHRSNVQRRSAEAELEPGDAVEATVVDEVYSALAVEHPADQGRPGVLPGLVLGGLGLGLVVPGACFTFGSVMLRLNTEVNWATPGTWILLIAIASLAALCYLGAATLLALAAKSLLRAARG